MTLVIGLHGAKGSGKDQFFKSARSMFPDLDIRKIAYADSIKNHVCRIFGLKDEHQYDTFKRSDVTFNGQTVPGRNVVREIGMLMRSYDSMQFVDYVERTVLNNPQAIWCITDLRFQNELQSVKHVLDGYVVKIKRPGYEFDGHTTETEFADRLCHVVLHNNGAFMGEYNKSVAATVTRLIQLELNRG